MKQYNFLPLVGIVLIVFLAACSGTNPEVSPTDSEGNADTQSNSVNETTVEIADVSQLIIGTMLLAETDYPVTPEQAETLLPLWQLYQSMVAEDTTASEELDAIIKQIQKLLSDVQLSEIVAVEYDNPLEFMDALGIEPSNMTTMGSIDDLPEDIRDQIGEGNMVVIEGGFVGAGEMPGGELPEGFRDGEVMEMDPEQLAELQAQQGGGGSMQSGLFLPALIEYLEGIAGS